MTGTGFTTDQVRTILFRDGEKCAMCGERATTANHRADRGHGGFKGANTLSNGSASCWTCNGLLESDPDFAVEGRRRGVKLSKYDDPRRMPYLSPLYGIKVLLDDLGGWRFCPETAVQ